MPLSSAKAVVGELPSGRVGLAGRLAEVRAGARLAAVVARETRDAFVVASDCGREF